LLPRGKAVTGVTALQTERAVRESGLFGGAAGFSPPVCSLAAAALLPRVKAVTGVTALQTERAVRESVLFWWSGGLLARRPLVGCGSFAAASESGD
jgi:hypothetical protein